MEGRRRRGREEGAIQDNKKMKEIEKKSEVDGKRGEGGRK